MSFARFGCEGSDVYLLDEPGVGGPSWVCCACCLRAHDMAGLGVSPSWRTPSIEAYLAHLQDHRDAGHVVPQSAFSSLEAYVHELAVERWAADPIDHPDPLPWRHDDDQQLLDQQQGRPDRR